MDKLIINGYVCRDGDGHLSLHRDKPIIRVYKDKRMYSSNSNKIALRRTFFPDLKFDDGVQEAEITINIKHKDYGKN